MARALVLGAASGLGLGGVPWLEPSSAVAQQQWQPSRLPASTNSAQPLNGGTHSANSASSNASWSSSTNPQSASGTPTRTGEDLGGGVVLRWRTSGTSPAAEQPSEHVSHAQAFSDSPNNSAHYGNEAAATRPSVRQAQYAPRGGHTNESNSTNPLRNSAASTGVRAVAYQQDQFADPFGDNTPPSLPDANLQNPNLQLPNRPADPQGNFQPPQFQPQQPNDSRSPTPGVDPLDEPELAPPPSSAGQDTPANPFLRERDQEEASPLDRLNPMDDRESPELLPLPEDDEDDDPLELPRRRRSDANSLTCNELRSQLRTRPLSAVDLNPSMDYGKGLRAIAEGETDTRPGEDFAEKSEVRDWTDYSGDYLTTGRMVDMRDNKVFIDVNGAIRTVPYRDLSDVDVAYISTLWNIPTKCGTGYERFIARNFMPSQVQWTASGLCHKPLYFEDPQLERYGHEIGPVLQPLFSSAHFFGSIAILPYKMGIHPPNECQYSLGYIRPGNCAPYMIQPFPISLRGAAVQAGVVSGAAALIP